MTKYGLARREFCSLSPLKWTTTADRSAAPRPRHQQSAMVFFTQGADLSSFFPHPLADPPLAMAVLVLLDERARVSSLLATAIRPSGPCARTTTRSR